jgi:hypothetical protein
MSCAKGEQNKIKTNYAKGSQSGGMTDSQGDITVKMGGFMGAEGELI